MNIWDSVHRGLEKASQEAGRIARVRRLRATIDGLTRDMHTQSTDLLNKTMELFVAGQLTQSELFPFCQELINLRQQLSQAEEELKQIQANQPPVQAGATTSYPSPGPADPPGSGEIPPTIYAPPPPHVSDPAGNVGEFQPTIYAPPPPGYQGYPESSGIATPPPPPPAGPYTISAMPTIGMDAVASPSTPPTGNAACPVCQTELNPRDAFCSNCGSPVQTAASPHAPTTFSATPLPAYSSSEQETRADVPFPVPPEHAAPAQSSPPANSGAPPAIPANAGTPETSIPPDHVSPVANPEAEKAGQDEGV